MNIFTKPKQTHRLQKQAYGYERGTVGEGQIRSLGITRTCYHTQSDRRGPTVQHKERYSVSATTFIKENLERMNTGMCTPESLCCTPKQTTL